MDSRDAWSTVVGRRGKGVTNPGKRKGTGVPAGGSGTSPAGQRKGRRRIPTTAAITIVVREGDYGDIIRATRRAIGENALKDMGIGELRTRKSMMGAYILEIPGGTREEREAKAEVLAGKLKEIFRERGDIKITRPLKMAQLRIRDLDESVEIEDIVQAVVRTGH